jgi:hypothetical protein
MSVSSHKPRSFASSHTKCDGKDHLTRHEHMNNNIDFSRPWYGASLPSSFLVLFDREIGQQRTLSRFKDHS